MKNQKKIKEKLENSLSYKANIEDFSCKKKTIMMKLLMI